MAIYSSNGTKLAESNTDIVLPDPGEVQQLKRMADSLQEEVTLAKEQAKAAKEAAEKANRRAFLSKLIALGAFLVSLATLVLKLFIPGF